MAIDVCRECGESISTDAAICPHCGIKRPSELGQIERVYSRLHYFGCLVGIAALALGGLVIGLLGLDPGNGLALLLGATIAMLVFGGYMTWTDRRRDAALEELERKRRQNPHRS